jgi:hypothetical protein
LQKRINVSASQIENYRQCPRRWWFRSIKKLQEPQSEAQRFGDRFAKAIEARLKGQPIPRFDALADLVVDKFLVSAESFFPREPNPDIHAERKIEFDVPDLPARMIGYIDVLDLSGSSARIQDHKTRSDRKYALTHEKLVSDVQLNIYAYAIRLDLPEARFLESSIGHINYVKPPRKMATNIEYLRDEWQPEVFARQIPLDTSKNDLIMEGVKSVIADMVTYSDSLLTPEQVPFDTTGDACYSYGQPCTYSAICPKFKLTPSLDTRSTNMALKSLPPPPPGRSANLPPAAAPPVVRAEEQVETPEPVASLVPPPPQRSATLPPPPPAGLKNVAPKVAAPPVDMGGVNPPPAPTKSLFQAPAIEDTEVEQGAREATPAMPLANILNLSQKGRAWLESAGFKDSFEIANLTEAYLMGHKITKTVLSDLLKVSLVLRGLHKVSEPDPFTYCPPLLPSTEQVASKAEMMSDLPDHALDSEPTVFVAPAAPAAPAKPAAPVKAAVAESRTVTTKTEAPFYLYLECFPIKGANSITLEEWLDPVFSEIEKEAGVQNWRSIVEFGRMNEMLHIAVRNIIEGRTEIKLPEHLVILSCYTEYAKATLDLLIRRATLVIKK